MLFPMIASVISSPLTAPANKIFDIYGLHGSFLLSTHPKSEASRRNPQAASSFRKQISVDGSLSDTVTSYSLCSWRLSLSSGLLNKGESP